MGHKYVKEEDTFNSSQNGTVPKPTPQEVTDNKFLRADGTWAAGAGGSVVSADQIGSSGTEIGGVTIDGVRTAFYAPNQIHTYSETEQRVGTWIDGKPVYEKTVTFGAIAANTNIFYINLAILTVEKVIMIDCYAYNSGTAFFRLPLALLKTQNQIDYGIEQQGFDTATGELRIGTGTYRAIAGGYVIIRYTKTTDQV